MTHEPFASRCDEGHVSFAAGLLCALDLRVADGFQPHRSDICDVSLVGKRRKYTFARSTRLGFIVAQGRIRMRVWPVARVYCWRQTQAAILCHCPTSLCGGATSHRGFAINSAGPRDLGTGYPVGGTGVLVNTLELRLPAANVAVCGRQCPS